VVVEQCATCSVAIHRRLTSADDVLVQTYRYSLNFLISLFLSY